MTSELEPQLPLDLPPDTPASPEPPADDGTQRYLALLESCVALLCISQGYNPELLLGNALQQLVDDSGMSSVATSTLIQVRWSGRDISAGQSAAKLLSQKPEKEPLSVTETAEQETAVTKLQAYRKRQSLARSAPNSPET